MPYTNGDGVAHARRRCRRLHNTGNRIRRVDDADGLTPCEHCGEPQAESESEPATIEDAIDAGECPWCDAYEGEYVGQHAGSAHPDKWAAYTED